MLFARSSELRTAVRDDAAIVSACRRYLATTRSAPPDTYERVEGDAWFELLSALEQHGRPLNCLRRFGEEPPAA